MKKAADITFWMNSTSFFWMNFCHLWYGKKIPPPKS